MEAELQMLRGSRRKAHSDSERTRRVDTESAQGREAEVPGWSWEAGALEVVRSVSGFSSPQTRS